ncbi:MAG TPA: type VI secretion system protein TssA [Syntrophales bacterium]|nr:type VI secretion system protein TssA [Syntrophales bacterium]HRT26510.1 type VI secretion system protein TssA [Syntrophales bacterium]
MSLLGLGNTPISERNPSGEDIRLDPDFEVLSGEMEKMSSPSVIGDLDWKKVVALSSDILAYKSKDILVACYLSVGLFRTEGLNGLASGVRILRDLLETFWESFFPPLKRMKARRNAVEWWLEKVRSGIAGVKTEIWPAEKKAAFIDDLKAIDSFVGKNMDDAPMMIPLITNISAVIAIEASAEEKPQDQEPPPVEEPPSPSEKASDRHTPLSDAETEKPREVFPETDAEKLIKQGLDTLGRAAAMYARRDPLNPLYFRLNRVVAWIPVTSLPPNSEGKTFIPPPDGEVVVALRNLHRSGSWKELLQSAESRVPEFLFWIDLSRYSAEALEKIGRKDLSEAVSMETSSYVGRLPGVERLAFSDGTPFADENTREWLKDIGGQAQVRQDIPVGYDTDELNEEIAKDAALALELLNANKLPEALNTLREKLNRASSARERFIREVGFCRLLAQTKQAGISDPYLQELLEHIDVYKLEQWEPSLAVEALATVLSSFHLRKGEKAEGSAKSIFDRIAAIDPARALNLL